MPLRPQLLLANAAPRRMKNVSKGKCCCRAIGVSNAAAVAAFEFTGAVLILSDVAELRCVWQAFADFNVGGKKLLVLTGQTQSTNEDGLAEHTDTCAVAVNCRCWTDA